MAEFLLRRYVKVNASNIVTGDNETSALDFEWAKFDAQPLPAGLIEVTTHPDWSGGGSLIGRRWTGTQFEIIPPAPARVISPVAFTRRFTLAEEAAIDTLADTNRIVKIWRYRLTLAQHVDLDHADVAAGLAYIKSVGIPSVWADVATADQRIRDIRANG